MIEAVLPIQPARVTHQSGTRFAQGHSYKSKPLKEWEQTLEKELREYVPNQPITQAIELAVCFAFRCKSKKQHGQPKTTKPDTDNMVKTLKDVMTGMGFWEDDALVAVEHVRKIWSREPYIAITVQEVDG